MVNTSTLHLNMQILTVNQTKDRKRTLSVLEIDIYDDESPPAKTPAIDMPVSPTSIASLAVYLLLLHY